MWTDSVTEFFRTFQFFFLQPFFKQILAILCKNWSSEFERFVTVQCTLVKENAKVLKNRGQLTRLYRHMFESFNRIWCSKNALQSEFSWKNVPLEIGRQL